MKVLAGMHKACNNRIQDVSNEIGTSLSPITLENTPLLSAQASLQPLESLVPDLDTHLFSCSFEIDNLDSLPPGLTRDEAIAVRIYTMEWQDKKESLYYKLNDSLRTASRDTIKPFFFYLKLLLTALSKLPSHQSPSMTLWRGVSSDISKQYRIGKKYFWWGFSSCTTDLEVLNGFIGAGPRVVFNILFQSHCVDIKELSCFSKESEVLLLPGKCFEVLNNSTLSQDGLTIIQMREVTTPPMIKGISFPDNQSISKTILTVPSVSPSPVVNSALKDWFHGLGFSGFFQVEYYEMFVSKGFDGLDILQLLQHFSMIPPGHKLKIWKAIQKLNSKIDSNEEKGGEIKNDKEILEKEILQQEKNKEKMLKEKMEKEKEKEQEKLVKKEKEKVETSETTKKTQTVSLVDFVRNIYSKYVQNWFKTKAKKHSPSSSLSFQFYDSW
eukprot:TRINITY_DN6042_c0_g1_i3.p1 TRINITY_DN6042_c0_g1~~TRINITY_DN6042_c0_g1_i3.p1  ORF type:complete len:440 (+),score=124.13 TRINITY_DN6042_c0_g1_i3:40-1359(+)